MTIDENWQNLSNWRKGILCLLTTMWLAFSGAIVMTFAASWFWVILSLSAIWLVFIAIAYTVVNAYQI